VFRKYAKTSSIKKSHALAGVIYVICAASPGPHLAHNHSNNQLLSSDACEEECPHHHPNGKKWKKDTLN